MVGDFTVKKCKIGTGNLYLTKNRLRKNKMWYVADNHNDVSHIWAKALIDSNFDKEVIYKISNLNKIAPNFTYSQKIVIS